MVNNILIWLKGKLPLLTVFVAIIANSAICSLIALLKFYAFNATAADLGINASLMYHVFHGPLSLNPANPNFINTGKLIYIVIAPFYDIHPSEPVLLVFQSVWVSMGAIPIFLLTKKRFQSDFVSVAFSLVWLLYYPLAGVEWFDFHFMALFPTFFLSGVAALEYGKRRIALGLLILSAMTDFLVLLIVCVYAVSLILKDYKSGKGLKENHLAWTLVVFSVAVFILTNVLNGFLYTMGYLQNPASSAPGFHASALYITIYFLWTTGPLFFFSYFAPEYMSFMIPFAILAYESAYRPYVQTMYFQYAALNAPIIFLSAIAGLKRIMKTRLFQRHAGLSLKRIVSGFLMLNVVFALLFTPAGDLLSHQIYNDKLGFFFLPEAPRITTLILK